MQIVKLTPDEYNQVCSQVDPLSVEKVLTKNGNVKYYNVSINRQDLINAQIILGG